MEICGVNWAHTFKGNCLDVLEAKFPKLKSGNMNADISDIHIKENYVHG